MHSHILTPALTTRIRAQRLAPAADPSAGAFHANLAAALNDRRAAHSLRTIVPPDWQSSSLTPELDNNPQQSKKIDFASNDILSFNATGQLYHHFLSELTTANPPGVNINIGSTGSRLLDGDSLYLSQTEQLIKTFHHAETGLLCSSGYDANVAVWTAIPRPGDVVLYDALVHASTHAGIARSLAMEKFEFKHGDVEDFREALGRVVREQGLVRAGRRSVLVAVEAVYSMDGDVCPLREMMEVAREVCGTEELRGSVQFVVDEAHSTGLLGEKGEGLVSALGLEKEIAVRVHTFGKCMGASGGQFFLVFLSRVEREGWS
jgi:8-amino-7-oxononanoate synthase